jgi:tRNA pseudouridine38-40 synthase
MRKALRHIIGRHDFRAFASRVPTDKDTVRTIKNARILRTGEMIIFRLTADGFLYNMVRNIVGTLFLVGQGKITSAHFKAILLSKDRTQAAAPVPAEGLALVAVRY